MAVTINGTSVSTTATGVTSIAVTMPAGIVVGELIWVVIGIALAATATDATGGGYWTQQAQGLDAFGGSDLAIFTRIADGTEGATRTFNLASSQQPGAIAFRTGGQDPIAPINVVSTQGTGTSGSNVAMTCPSVTTTVAGAMILRFGVTRQTGGLGMTTPAGNTIVGSADTGLSFNDSSTQVAYSTQTSAGATGTAAFVANGGFSKEWTAYTIAIAPAASGGVALTGVSATGSAGTVSQSRTVALTGTTGTGSAGTVSPSQAGSAALTGVTASGSVGTVKPSDTVPDTGVSATGSPGNVGPGNAVGFVGVSATGSTGTLKPSTVVGLSGVSATGSVGTVSPTQAGQAALSGVTATGTAGSLSPSSTFGDTGTTGTGSTGNVGPATSIGLSAVSGSGSTGSISSARVIGLTGVTATGTAGNVTVANANVTVALTGVITNTSVGTVTPSGGDSGPGADTHDGAWHGYGQTKRKKRYVVRKGDELLEFTTKAAAVKALKEPAKPVNATPIPLAEVKAYAEKIGQGKEYAAAIQAQEYEKALELRARAIDEEEIELLLLHV